MKKAYFEYTGTQLESFQRYYSIDKIDGRMALCMNCGTGKWIILMGLDIDNDMYGGAHITVGEYESQKSAESYFNDLVMVFNNGYVKP